MKVGALLLAAALCVQPAVAGTPRFADETAASGIDHTYAGDWEYMVGGGAASFDCDDDGFPDLLLAGGAAPAGFFRNVSRSGGPLRFQRQTSGLELDAVTGAYPLDVDGDGRQDLVLLRIGENVLFRGLGGCRFERANEAFGFAGGDGWSTAFAATFEAGRIWPTLAVGNYIDRNAALPWGSCTDNHLHRPAGADQRRFAPPQALTPSHCALSMLFTDWKRSGTADLRVSNDREYYKGGQEQLWHLPPGSAPALYTAAEGWQFLRIWGMGIAGQDLDGDGYPEYFLTSMADNKLQTLKAVAAGTVPRPTYADVAFARGVTAHRPHAGGDIRPSTAWHAEFEDVDNDGRMDLFIAKGNVAEMPDFAARDPNNLLMQEEGGRFVEAAEQAGVASMAVGRGAALDDFNLDGRVDLVVVNRWTAAEVWRNDTADAGRFVAVRPAQDGPNRDGVGAWVELRSGGAVVRRELTVGGGHAGGQIGWIHFGLGDREAAEVRVLWPDGTAGPWQAVAADRFYRLERAAPAPRPWTPGR